MEHQGRYPGRSQAGEVRGLAVPSGQATLRGPAAEETQGTGQQVVIKRFLLLWVLKLHQGSGWVERGVQSSEGNRVGGSSRRWEESERDTGWRVGSV